MSLLDKISNCRTLVEDVSRNRGNAIKDAERIKNNNSFFDAFDSFFFPSYIAYSIVAKNTSYKFPTEVVSKVKECVSYAENACAKKQVQEPIKFRSNSVSMRDKLAQSWSENVKSENASLLDNLGILKLVYPDKYAVQRLVTAIQNQNNWPVTKKQIDDALDATNKANELVSSIHFDAEIEEFLRKVRDKRATLQDLTDPIIKWIRDNNYEGSIQLSISIS